MVRALRQVESHGLPGEHHFYITFRTDHPRAALDAELKARYPEEITIVLQHQFWGLKVDDTKFEVTLSFNQMPQTLVVPFQAVTAFVDPSVKFGLQFRAVTSGDHEEEVKAVEEPQATLAPATEEAPPTAASDNIVALDQFRKK